MRTHRRIPNRKTLGTAYNLKPDTRPVEAHRLQPGDVVVLEAEAECPIVISKMIRLGTARVRLWGRYIWQADFDPKWPLGEFGWNERLPTAIPGEYPAPPRRPTAA